MPSRYITTEAIQALIRSRDSIFAEHQRVWAEQGIDILANDTLSSLTIWEIVRKYDPDYNINFHRNGEDARSQGVLIEQKCATKQPTKKGQVGRVGFQFHAQGHLDSDRYIFAVRRKDTLELVRIWDIATLEGCQRVQTVLAAQRQRWIDRGKPNHDAILVAERDLEDLTVIEELAIQGCRVRRV